MSEHDLIRRYFDAFNRHDLDAVLACFHPAAMIIGSDGSRHDGLEAVRALYVEQFAVTPDGRCDLRSVAAADGCAEAESLFHGTRARDGRVVRAIGVERFEFVDGCIKEIRVSHRPAG